jgi:hypothetical protein
MERCPIFVANAGLGIVRFEHMIAVRGISTSLLYIPKENSQLLNLQTIAYHVMLLVDTTFPLNEIHYQAACRPTSFTGARPFS